MLAVLLVVTNLLEECDERYIIQTTSHRTVRLICKNYEIINKCSKTIYATIFFT